MTLKIIFVVLTVTIVTSIMIRNMSGQLSSGLAELKRVERWAQVLFFLMDPGFSFYFYLWTKVWTRVGPGGMMTNQEMKKEKDLIGPGLS